MQKDPHNPELCTETVQNKLSEFLASVLRELRKNPFRRRCPMQTVRTFAAIAVLGIVFFPSPRQILAQQTPAQQQMDLNENQLRSVAKVYVQIEKVLQTYAPQLKEAKTPEEGKQIQNEAMSKMQQALTQEGMNEQSYRRIIEIANADDGLRKKLLGFINEEKQKS